jgi:polar amino acid transport system substrate-binding protein
MKRMKKQLLFVVLIPATIAMVLITFGCGAKAPKEEVVAAQSTFQRILETKEVNIGVISVAPPYDYINEDGEPDGFEIKAAREMGKALVGEDGKVNLIDLLPQNRIPALQTGEIDIGSYAMGLYPERAKLILYTDHPLYVIPSVLFGRVGLKVNTWDDLSGLKVGAVKGTAGAIQLNELAPDDVKISNFDDDPLMQNAMIAGQIDIIPTGDLVAYELMDKYPGRFEIKFYVTVETEHLVVRKGDNDLKDWLDAWVLHNYTNGNLAKWWAEYMVTPYGNMPTMATDMIDYNR